MHPRRKKGLMVEKETKGQLPIITTSFLVMGNVLGVGVLALPIKCGLSGFAPALTAIVVIWAVMLLSAWVIAYKINIEKSDSFDIPSFYGNSLGNAGKWIAIVCNLILLYGVLVAYLGGISTMVSSLVKDSFPNLGLTPSLITLVYFSVLTTMILFGMEALRKGNMVVIAVIWISFFGLVFTGVSQFDVEKLAYTDWKLMVVGLPVAVSAFHFHNIIPTVSRALSHDVAACRKAIFIGVFLGLLINLIWITVVMGTMAEKGYGLSKDTIEEAYWYGLPATVPMAEILKSRLFTLFGTVFAVFAVTASYMANGAGLFGFIRDMTVTYLKKDSRFLVGCLSFLPPLIIALVYPNIFLSALDIVGGVGETVLFAILPAVILIQMTRSKNRSLSLVGYVMLIIGVVVLAYVVGDKLGVIDLVPPDPKASVPSN